MWTPANRTILSGTDVASHFRNHVDQIVCYGMRELTTELNMASWLRGWKQLLRPGGTLVAELKRHVQDQTWRDTARRYAEMASPLGFRLHMVNGCDVEWGGLLQPRLTGLEWARISSKYRCLSAQLGQHGRHGVLCAHLEEKARGAARGAADEFITDRSRLYGLFLQCHPAPWEDL